MSERRRCPRCGRASFVDADAAPVGVRCPSCGGTFLEPHAAQQVRKRIRRRVLLWSPRGISIALDDVLRLWLRTEVVYSDRGQRTEHVIYGQRRDGDPLRLLAVGGRLRAHRLAFQLSQALGVPVETPTSTEEAA